MLVNYKSLFDNIVINRKKPKIIEKEELTENILIDIINYQQFDKCLKELKNNKYFNDFKYENLDNETTKYTVLFYSFITLSCIVTLPIIMIYDILL